jgi:hypothetical protein
LCFGYLRQIWRQAGRKRQKLPRGILPRIRGVGRPTADCEAGPGDEKNGLPADILAVVLVLAAPRLRRRE